MCLHDAGIGVPLNFYPQVIALRSAGEALAPLRDKVMIDTKSDFNIDLVTGVRSPGVNSRPEHIRAAFAWLIRQDKVRHFGLLEAGASTGRRAQAVQPLAAVQSEYTLWFRCTEVEVLPTLQELGIGFVPLSPLGASFLTCAIDAAARFESVDFPALVPHVTP